MTARIFDIQRFCLHDGEGVRTTVFFKGCPLRCKWCHNPESQKKEIQLMFYPFKCSACSACVPACPARAAENGALRFSRELCRLCGGCIAVCPNEANKICGRDMSVQEIMENVLDDKIFYGNSGGMTVSGGEPFMQSAALLELLSAAKGEKLSAVIETSGFAAAEDIKRAAELGAVFYYDIKALDEKTHIACTGVSNRLILENLSLLFSLKAPVVLRLPLIDGMNDGERELELLADFLKAHRAEYISAQIMPYHNLGRVKAGALGVQYNAPAENSSEEQNRRRLAFLKERGAVNISISE